MAYIAFATFDDVLRNYFLSPRILDDAKCLKDP